MKQIFTLLAIERKSSPLTSALVPKAVTKISFMMMIAFGLFLSFDTYGQLCSETLACTGDRVTTINYDNLPLCGSGTSNFLGEVKNGNCEGINGNAFKCHKYIITRSSSVGTVYFRAKFGQGAGCTGEMDASYLSNNASCSQLSGGGSSTQLEFPLQAGDLDFILYGCLNSNAQVSLCDVCRSNTTLPIDLIDFKAQNTDKSISLKWRTAEEKNVNFFAIERSKNGKDFKEIAQVKTGAASKEYSLTDEKPFYGTSYYRLKMAENDGSAVNFSKTVSVNMSTKGALKVTPTTASDKLTVDLPENLGEITINVMDMTGKVIKSVITISLQESINVTDMAPGMYIINAQSGVDTFIERFMKQ